MTDTTIFSQVTKPGRYLGSEYNSIQKNWDNATVRCALVFPDLYEIGMSHQGLQILYHILNSNENFLAERSYAPDKDVERLLRSRKEPLTSLESGRSLGEFDLIAITLPYELCYTNILTVLDLSGIPLLAKDRSDSFPIVLGGGACSMNPEPVADFFDAILLGDGEEAVPEIAEVLALAKSSDLSKDDLLVKLATIEGVYIPSFFAPQYDNSGHVTAIENTNPLQQTVIRRIVPDLAKTDHLLNPIVPNAKIVHDRLGVEIARGCTRGCRFCQAGITYRPVRERTPEQIMSLAKKGIENSGFEEMALLSLSTGDYSCLGDVLPKLMDEFADNYVSVAMPSMRVGTLTPEIMEQIKRVRKTGFTLAPEAGSERLRRVINKGITEDNLLTSCRTAFSLGWKVMKFYFMIGLPTESMDDIDEIIELVKKSGYEIDSVAKGKKKINVSIGTFVPKPHTPFQWNRQLTIEESRDRINYLKQNLPRKGCNMKWHSPEQSFLEGVFSRGDRRLSRLIHQAWSEGARLDGWSDHFNLTRWKMAAESCQLDLDDYLRERDIDEVLPWQHLDTGVDLEFLKQEWQNALEEVYTPDCRYHGCQQCGLCDFDIIQPIVHSDIEPGTTAPGPVTPIEEQPRNFHPPASDNEPHFKYIVNYSRTGNICYLGHLEILQLVFRALRRANITTNFSKGFNPSPKISFGPALPVGTRSMAEFFIMDLPELLHSTESAAKNLSAKLPPGLEVTSIQLHSGKLAQVITNSYTIQFDRLVTKDELQRIADFIAGDELIISRVRKGKKRQFNIRPLITTFELINEDTLHMDVINRSGSPGIKPSDALQHILGITEAEALAALITKTGWEPLDED